MIPLSLRLLLVVALLVSVESAARAQGRPGTGGSIGVHYDQREISVLVDKIARATGRRYLYSDSLRGRVSITVPDRVSYDEAIALLNAALHIKGFAALPVGADTTKIVPIAETNTSAPLVAGPLDPEGQRPISTLVRLEHASAQRVAVTLRPYVSAAGLALAYPPSNSIILAGTEARVSRLITIIRLLDQAANEDVLVRSLRYRSAETVADVLELQFNQSAVAANHARIWTDPRTNQIVVRAPSTRLDTIREAIKEIDQPIEGGGLMRVIRILNRDANELAEMLLGMQKGVSVEKPAVGATEAAQIGEGLSGRGYSVTVDSATRSLVLASDSGTLDLLAGVVAKLDQLPPRVVVDVLVFEFSRPSGFALGFEYFLPLLAPKTIRDPAVFLSSGGASILNTVGLPSTGVPSSPSGQDFLFGRYTREPLQLTIDSGDGDPITIAIPRENVAFQAGEAMAETNILLHPHILAISGEEHEIFVGDEIPVPTGSSSAAGQSAGLNPALTQRQVIERRDVGIRLNVKPTVGVEGVVILDIALELSGIESSIAGPVEKVGPTFTERKLESTLRLSEGQFAVIGTSNGTGEDVQYIGVPFLKDIPFIGWMFGSVKKTRMENDLIMVVEVELLRDANEELAETIRREIALERSMARVADLRDLGTEPFAILLDTVRDGEKARRIADAFAEDGFKSRITEWQSTEGWLWDIYLTNFATFEDAGGVARRLSDAGWSPEITVISPQNPLAGD